MSLKAVMLDVGGVMLLPDREMVSTALTRAAIAHDATRIDTAHYLGVHAADGFNEHPGHGSFTDVYRATYISSMGIAVVDLARAAAALGELFLRPSIQVWTQAIPGASETVHSLVAAGISVAIVSNADGTVEESLASLDICQVGPGLSTPVSAIVDSTVVGISKPDPRIFAHALSLLGVPACKTTFVGDSEWNDIRGAAQIGIQSVHYDPLGLCRQRSRHNHIQSLSELGSELYAGALFGETTSAPLTRLRRTRDTGQR